MSVNGSEQQAVSQPARKPVSRAMRIFLIVAGHFFVLLGIIGAILPLMPTTIFLILAGACYGRSSEKFYCWLYSNRYFGNYLRNYKEKRGTPISIKVGSISILWLSIGSSLLLTKIPWFVQWILMAIGIGVTIHLVMIRTLKKEEHES